MSNIIERLTSRPTEDETEQSPSFGGIDFERGDGPVREFDPHDADRWMGHPWKAPIKHDAKLARRRRTWRPWQCDPFAPPGKNGKR